MISSFVTKSLAFSAFSFGRDWALLPVKMGDEKGCENLQKKVDDLREKMHVDIPIKVAEYSACPWAAHGGICFGAGGITVPSTEIKELIRENDDTQIALLAHEISHIKHNDGPWMLVITLVTLAVATVFAWWACPEAWFFIAEQLIMIPVLPAFFIRSRIQERAADVEACKHITNAQKQAISDFFEKIRQNRLDDRSDPNLSPLKKLWKRFWINSDGDFLLEGLMHP
nr:Protease HtpX [Chlamydiota bacterium]